MPGRCYTARLGDRALPGRRNDALLELARVRKWGDVFDMLGRGNAGADDHHEVRRKILRRQAKHLLRVDPAAI